MTKEMANFLRVVTENAGNECDVRDDYSGRGMMGRTTYGIVVDSATLLVADVVQYMSECIDKKSDVWIGLPIPEPETFRVDNMAMKTILY